MHDIPFGENLKKSGEEYMRRFRRKKGNGEMVWLSDNLKNKCKRYSVREMKYGDIMSRRDVVIAYCFPSICSQGEMYENSATWRLMAWELH